MSDAGAQDPKQLADQISATLNETNPAAIAQIRDLVRVMGEEFAQTVLQETLEIERNGGMVLEKHNRRRTPGGVYLYLARGRLPREKRAQIFQEGNKTSKKPQTAQKPVVEIEITAEARLAAENIVARLQDTDPERLETIARLIQVAGAKLTDDALEIALEMENQGGMRKKDGTRRSPGGALLYVASRRLSEEQRRQVWPVLPEELAPPVNTPAKSQSAPPASRPPAPAGMATTAKLTLVGRPASVQNRQGYVAFQLQNDKVPNLPKGLPAPVGGSVYTVYVAQKQWNKIAAAIEDPQDALIIEGYPTVNAKNGKVILLATSVAGKLAKQAQKSPPGGD